MDTVVQLHPFKRTAAQEIKAHFFHPATKLSETWVTNLPKWIFISNTKGSSLDPQCFCSRPKSSLSIKLLIFCDCPRFYEQLLLPNINNNYLSSDTWYTQCHPYTWVCSYEAPQYQLPFIAILEPPHQGLWCCSLKKVKPSFTAGIWVCGKGGGFTFSHGLCVISCFSESSHSPKHDLSLQHFSFSDSRLTVLLTVEQHGCQLCI